MKKLLSVTLVILGGVICTHSASAQTKAIEVTSAGNMRFYGHQDIRFGNNENWGVEYVSEKGLNFFRKNTDGSWAEYQLLLRDDGNVQMNGLCFQGIHQTAIFGNDEYGNPALYPLSDGSLRIGYGSTKRVYVNAVQVWANWFTSTSDERAKENIHEIATPLTKLTKLKGVQYDIKKSNVSDSTIKIHSGKRDARKDNLGFLAQDLQKVFPELVVIEDSTGMYGINYIGLIPVLVEALKEQQVQIAMLQQQVAVLGANNTVGNNGKPKLKSGSADSETSESAAAASSIVLHQNNPNPFSTSTEIAMELPAEVQDAKLAIYNLAGEQRLSIAVADRGTATVRIEAGQLKPGIYIYGIIADGQLAASKQMVVTE